MAGPSRRLPERPPADRAVIVVALGLAAVVALWRIYLTVDGAGFGRRYFATDTRSDGLLIGCALGVAVSKFGLPSKHTAWALGGFGLSIFLTMLLIANNGAAFMYLWGWIAVAFSAAALILGSLDAPPLIKTVLEWRPLIGLGRISYGLYLWHGIIYFVIHRMPQLSDSPSWVVGGGEVGLSLAVALASYYVVERPALKLKSRFSPRPTASQPGLTVAREATAA